MFARLIVSFLIFGFGSWVDFSANAVEVLYSGKMAGYQMQSSDPAYFVSMSGMRMFQDHSGLITLLCLFALAVIWAKPFIKLLAAMLVLLALMPQPSYAFWQTTDKAEAYTILPNQTAFWIPDVGDNKNSQASISAGDYAGAQKVLTKRFVIPHHKFQNSGGWAGWDAYVPDGRLIIVDRTTFSHEWVDSTDRGSSSAKQGFPCQTMEGINVSLGISVGADVADTDAATFLSNFGVVPPKGDPTDPATIFTSVYYSRTVQDVMDTVGRRLIQGIACREIGSRTLDQVNRDTNAIMDGTPDGKGHNAGGIIQLATAALSQYGITLKYIGWADTFTFDPIIQTAINEKYRAAALAPSLPNLEALAQVQIQYGLAAGLTNHGLPVVVTPQMLDVLEGLVGGIKK